MTDAAPSAPPPPPAQAPTPAAPPPLVSRTRRMMWGVVLGVIALIGAGLILHAWGLPPFSGGPQTTENAYVRGQVTIISPRSAAMSPRSRCRTSRQ